MGRGRESGIRTWFEDVLSIDATDGDAAGGVAFGVRTAMERVDCSLIAE